MGKRPESWQTGAADGGQGLDCKCFVKFGNEECLYVCVIPVSTNGLSPNLNGRQPLPTAPPALRVKLMSKAQIS